MLMPEGFCITFKKGFHIKFANGYTVSVQFGPGNYCDNYDMDIVTESEKAGAQGSSTAEVAVLLDGELIETPFFQGYTVGGRFTPAEVLELMNWASSQEGEK